MSALVVIGRVAGPHGVRGRLKVEPLTFDPKRFSSLKALFLVPVVGEPRRFLIESITYQPRFVLVKLQGIDGREAARPLVGAYAKIPETDVPPAGEDEYYYFQLEGLRVETSEGEPVGVLDHIVASGGNDVYWVRTPDGKDYRLVPALKQAIQSIDLEQGLMIVGKDWVV